MRTTCIILVLALLSFASASPSFRRLQDNATVVDNSTAADNTTVVNNSTAADNTTVVNNSTASNTTVINNSTNSTGASNTTVITNSTNSTNSTVAVNPHPGYTALNVSEAKNDTQINGAFLEGMNAIIQTAISQGKIPLSLYNITNWTNAWAKNVSNGVSYAFDAVLVGANGAVVNANVTVRHNNTSGANGLTAYHFTAANIKTSQFPGSGYTWLTPAQIHNHTAIQGALVYGAQTTIQYLIAQNKIPAQNLNYTITALNKPSYRTVTTGTFYKFQVETVNGNGVHVNSNYTIFYRNSNKNYTQQAFTYLAYNFSNADLVQNNNSSNITVINNSTTSNTTVVDNSTSPDNTTVVNNGTAASNTTVINNSTTNATSSDSGNSTAANTTTVGGDSTSGATNLTNATNPVPVVNVDDSRIIAQYGTANATATPLVFEWWPVGSGNSVSNGTVANVTAINASSDASDVVSNTTIINDASSESV